MPWGKLSKAERVAAEGLGWEEGDWPSGPAGRYWKAGPKLWADLDEEFQRLWSELGFSRAAWEDAPPPDAGNKD